MDGSGATDDATTEWQRRRLSARLLVSGRAQLRRADRRWRLLPAPTSFFGALAKGYSPLRMCAFTADTPLTGMGRRRAAGLPASRLVLSQRRCRDPHSAIPRRHIPPKARRVSRAERYGLRSCVLEGRAARSGCRRNSRPASTSVISSGRFTGRPARRARFKLLRRGPSAQPTMAILATPGNFP